jgi:hypothetical protein
MHYRLLDFCTDTKARTLQINVRYLVLACPCNLVRTRFCRSHTGVRVERGEILVSSYDNHKLFAYNATGSVTMGLEVPLTITQKRKTKKIIR